MSLHADAYTVPKWHDIDQRAIFARSWQWPCHVETRNTGSMPGFDPSTVCLDRIQVDEYDPGGSGLSEHAVHHFHGRPTAATSNNGHRTHTAPTRRPLPDPEAAFSVFVCHAWNHPDTCLL
ncbi:hypothetical protein ACFYUV_37930 [Nonomuraea sp. NPDC003560]|uniref:hypothetical protein n=1 Tax=Nonomuraea sp. NPDC003560 TaxID=3364341 RepID=UPI00369ABCF7